MEKNFTISKRDVRDAACVARKALFRRKSICSISKLDFADEFKMRFHRAREEENCQEEKSKIFA